MLSMEYHKQTSRMSHIQTTVELSHAQYLQTRSIPYFLPLMEPSTHPSTISVRKMMTPKVSFSCVIVYTATYDVQSLSVVEEGDGVVVTGEFITDSRAGGCLLVLQGPSSSSSPDIFRTIQRTQLELGSTITVPPSTYTVYGYDIEEDWLPNTMPAVVMGEHISSSACK